MEFTGERFIPTQRGSIESEHLNRYYFVINQIKLTGKTVLDIASGEGYGSNILSQYSQNVIGVDISTEAVKHASNLYKANNLKFLQGDATNIPLEDNSVDVVVSFETIEHHDKHNEMMLEIKRVLKKDGVIVISSPDRHYYSDVPNFSNNFHVKELYYDEFKSLIKTYFKKTSFYSQKIIVGSIIALDENKLNYTKPVEVNQEGKIAEFTPVYNIAIATDNDFFEPRSQMVFYKSSENIITQEDIREAIKVGIKSVQQTKAYRLGNLVIKPLKKIKSIFNG